MMKAKRKLSSFPKYEEKLHEALRDGEEAKFYLQAAMSDYQQEGDMSCLLLAIRDVVKARGGMTALSEKTKLSRESLYKALSNTGNPQFSTLWIILSALGFHFVIEPLDKAA